MNQVVSFEGYSRDKKYAPSRNPFVNQVVSFGGELKGISKDVNVAIPS